MTVVGDGGVDGCRWVRERERAGRVLQYVELVTL